MEKLAQSGGGTIHVSGKILFAFCHQQSSSQESIAGFGHTVPCRAARTSGVRHFSGPLTLSSAHAQLVAGMQIIREITCEHKETQPQVLLPEFGLFCSQPLLSRLSTSAERFLSPNARYPHKVSAFTASLPFRTANRTDRWCAVSGSRAFFTYGRCSLDIPRA